MRKLLIATRQKLRGTNIHLERGMTVFAVAPEEDGWITVKTEHGEEGEIPVSCLKKGSFKKLKYTTPCPQNYAACILALST